MKTGTIRYVQEIVLEYEVDPKDYVEEGAETVEEMVKVDAQALLMGELVPSYLEECAISLNGEVIEVEVLDWTEE